MTASNPVRPPARTFGVTASERYLQRLCDRSFLSLWNYCGLYKHQKATAVGDGKELCDLLVAFENDVIVFSDKSCSFKSTGNIGVDWHRWFRKSIEDAARQAWHVEPFVRQYPDRIFLDRACTHPFPIDLPPSDRLRVHYIVVTHNIEERVRQHFNTTSGSLVFNSALTRPEHYRDLAASHPFEIGWVDDRRPFVHVLHDYSLDVVLKTLDTIRDFVGYLRAKEDLLTEFKSAERQLVYTAEEDLMALYLFTMRGKAHGFNVPAKGNVLIEAGEWDRLSRHPKFRARKKANEISYTWDKIIEKFIQQMSHHHKSGLSTAEVERGLKFLAREGRVRRRMLSQQLYEMLGNTDDNADRRRIEVPTEPGEPYFVFLLCARHKGMSQDKYQEFRRQMLADLCRIAKVLNPAAEDIVGFATDSGVDTPNRSEDLVWFDARSWTDRDQEFWLQVQRETGYFTNVRKGTYSVVEFPEPAQLDSIRRAKVGRNQPCPCGSGKKHKRCCGR